MQPELDIWLVDGRLFVTSLASKRRQMIRCDRVAFQVPSLKQGRNDILAGLGDYLAAQINHRTLGCRGSFCFICLDLQAEQPAVSLVLVKMSYSQIAHKAQYLCMNTHALPQRYLTEVCGSYAELSFVLSEPFSVGEGRKRCPTFGFWLWPC